VVRDPLFFRGRDSLPPSDSLSLTGAFTHTVQFYEPPLFPARNVADYFCAGIEAEESSLIIATPGHTRMIKDGLGACGVEADTLENAGVLICLDAENTLIAVQGNTLDREKSVEEVLGPTLARAIKASPSGRMRVFGEAVNLLASRGEYDKCAQLERSWNKVMERYSLRVYCAYSLAGFSDQSSAQGMCDVCDVHDEIAGDVPELGHSGWQALVLQRSLSRQSEIQARKTIERTLRQWESEYARLFDAHVGHWRDCIEQGLIAPAPPGRPPYSKSFDRLQDDLGPTLERALQEIVLACGEACAARKSHPVGSVEWHKRTGEILAYGKLTCVLDSLQRHTRTRRTQ
jgi:MEDS: MEthanogen/methylotroph, DcmR Sensory domain